MCPAHSQVRECVKIVQTFENKLKERGIRKHAISAWSFLQLREVETDLKKNFMRTELHLVGQSCIQESKKIYYEKKSLCIFCFFSRYNRRIICVCGGRLLMKRLPDMVADIVGPQDAAENMEETHLLPARQKVEHASQQKEQHESVYQHEKSPGGIVPDQIRSTSSGGR
jgi:hypothetical protein